MKKSLWTNLIALTVTLVGKKNHSLFLKYNSDYYSKMNDSMTNNSIKFISFCKKIVDIFALNSEEIGKWVVLWVNG